MPTITHLLNRTVEVNRFALTDDGQGGSSQALQAVGVSLKGRRNPASAKDRIVAGREEAEVTHVWYFDAGADVKVRDVLVSNGVSDEVLAILPPSVADYLKVQVKEFQLGAVA